LSTTATTDHDGGLMLALGCLDVVRVVEKTQPAWRVVRCDEPPYKLGYGYGVTVTLRLHGQPYANEWLLQIHDGRIVGAEQIRESP
jgi:hypothetical protein